MLTLLLIAFLAATPAPTEPPKVDCDKVCPTKPPKKKPAKKITRRPPVVKPAPAAPVQVQAQAQQQSQTVVVVINQAQPEPAKAVILTPAEESDTPVVVIGLRGALGLWSCGPYVFGQVGLRARFPTVHLGAEINTQFYWGHGAQLMVYPIQRETSGSPINWHLNAGMLWHAHYGFGAQDVDRRWDMTFGTGIEWPFLPWLSLTADFRTAIPNPVTLSKYAWPDENGKYLNVGNVVANSFLRSQVTVGLMIHTF